MTEKTIGSQQVLVDSQGMTLYWFALDTPTKSNCSGQCATYWPPVKGPLTAGSGVTGTLGTITRSDGTTQATYDGHPLYTYVGDKSPGQATGNGKNLSGGLWWEMTVSGSTPAAAAGAGSTAKATSGGGGVTGATDLALTVRARSVQGGRGLRPRPPRAPAAAGPGGGSNYNKIISPGNRQRLPGIRG